MKFQQPPLRVDCDGLSRKLIAELAYQLTPFFTVTELVDKIIYCHKPRSSWHYNIAWRILDKFAVKVT